MGQQDWMGLPTLFKCLLAEWPAVDLPALHPQPRGRSWVPKGAARGRVGGQAGPGQEEPASSRGAGTLSPLSKGLEMMNVQGRQQQRALGRPSILPADHCPVLHHVVIYND